MDRLVSKDPTAAREKRSRDGERYPLLALPDFSVVGYSLCCTHTWFQALGTRAAHVPRTCRMEYVDMYI